MAEAAVERFRPIVMITLAAVLGMLPMALGRGIGAEMRTGVGIASAGGILSSGVLTVLVIPLLYNLFTRDPKEPSDLGRAWNWLFRRRKGKRKDSTNTDSTPTQA